MKTTVSVVVYLAGAARNGCPVMLHRGRSGLDHKFLWNNEHQKHLLRGRELTVEEWNKDASEILTSTAHSFFQPVVLVKECPRQRDDGHEDVPPVVTCKGRRKKGGGRKKTKGAAVLPVEDHEHAPA